MYIRKEKRKNKAKQKLKVSKIIRYVIISLSLSVSQQSSPRDAHTSLAVSLPTWKLSAADGMSVLPRAPPSREISAYSTLIKSKGENYGIRFVPK